jgi:hypothetical protein
VQKASEEPFLKSSPMQHIINNTRYSFTGNNPPDCLLAIICVTYNHSRFIKQALESFFEQVTDFRFKILVFNDCSNDKTQEILHEAAAARKNIGVFNSSANLGAEQNFINALSKSILNMPRCAMGMIIGKID